jgi:hypothetical protein
MAQDVRRGGRGTRIPGALGGWFGASRPRERGRHTVSVGWLAVTSFQGHQLVGRQKRLGQ